MSNANAVLSSTIIFDGGQLGGCNFVWGCCVTWNVETGCRRAELERFRILYTLCAIAVCRPVLKRVSDEQSKTMVVCSGMYQDLDPDGSERRCSLKRQWCVGTSSLSAQFITSFIRHVDEVVYGQCSYTLFQEYREETAKQRDFARCHFVASICHTISFI